MAEFHNKRTCTSPHKSEMLPYISGRAPYSVSAHGNLQLTAPQCRYSVLVTQPLRNFSPAPAVVLHLFQRPPTETRSSAWQAGAWFVARDPAPVRRRKRAANVMSVAIPLDSLPQPRFGPAATGPP